MRKLGIIIVVLAVIALAGYSVFWFMQAGKIKEAAEGKLKQVAETLREQGGDLVYANIETSGFPFAFEVSVEKPSVAIVGEDKTSTTIQSDESIKVIAPIKGNHVELALPKVFVISAQQGEASEILTSTFREEPVINATFENVDIISLLKGEFPESEDGLMKALRQFSYEDKGSVVTDANGTQIYSQEGSKVDFATAIKDGRRTADISVKGINGLVGTIAEESTLARQWFGMYQGLGNVNFAADLSFEGPEKLEQILSSEGSLVVRDISLVTDKYGIRIAGTMNKASDDIFPFGEIKLSLNQFEGLVDIWATSLREGMKQAEAENKSLVSFEIKDDQVNTIKKYLRHVSDEPQGTGQDITITIKRDKGEMDAKVGTLTSQEARELTQKTSDEVMGTQGQPIEGQPPVEEQEEGQILQVPSTTAPATTGQPTVAPTTNTPGAQAPAAVPAEEKATEPAAESIEPVEETGNVGGTSGEEDVKAPAE